MKKKNFFLSFTAFVVFLLFLILYKQLISSSNRILTKIKANIITPPTPTPYTRPSFKNLTDKFNIKLDTLLEDKVRIPYLAGSDFTFREKNNKIYFGYRIPDLSNTYDVVNWKIFENNTLKSSGESKIKPNFPFAKLYDFATFLNEPAFSYSVPEVDEIYIYPTLNLRFISTNEDIKISSPSSSAISAKIISDNVLAYIAWDFNKSTGIYTSGKVEIYVPTSKTKGKTYWKKIPFAFGPIAAIKDANNKIHIAMETLGFVPIFSQKFIKNFSLKISPKTPIYDIKPWEYYGKRDPKTGAIILIKRENTNRETEFYIPITYITYLRFNLNTLRWEKELTVSENVREAVKHMQTQYASYPYLYLEDDHLRIIWLDSRDRVTKIQRAPGRYVYIEGTANLFGRDLNLKTDKLSFEYKITKNGLITLQQFTAGKINKDLPFAIVHTYPKCLLSSPSCSSSFYSLGFELQTDKTLPTPIFQSPIIFTDFPYSIHRALSIDLDGNVYFLSTKLIDIRYQLYSIKLHKMRLYKK